MDSALLHLIGQDSDDGAGAGNTQTSRPGIVRRHQQFRQRGKDRRGTGRGVSLHIEHTRTVRSIDSIQVCVDMISLILNPQNNCC